MSLPQDEQYQNFKAVISIYPKGQMTKSQIRVQIKARNDLVLSRMEALGIPNVTALCKMSKVVQVSIVGSIINLQASPIDRRTKKREWRSCILAISRYLGASPEELFPRSIQQVRINPEVPQYFKMNVNRAGQFRMHPVPARILQIVESAQ